MEARPEDDGVDLALGAVGRDDRVGADLLDALGDELDVVLRERRVVVVAEQDALAADPIAGTQLLAQRRVAHLAMQMQAAEALEPLHGPLVHEAQDEQLPAPVDGGPREALQARNAPVGPALHGADRAVGVAQDPGRRALVDVQAIDVGLDPRDELDRRSPRPDHRDALPGQRVVVVPRRGVEDGALELLQPWDLGRGGLAQGAHAGDEDVGGERPGGGLDDPARLVLVPGGFGDLMAEAHVGEDLEALRAVAQVVPDFLLEPEGARPAPVRREGEGVQVRGHVALAAGIAVVAPCASDVVGALEHDEVLHPLLLEADRHPQAGEPGADDGHPGVRSVSVAAHRATTAGGMDVARPRSDEPACARVGVAASRCSPHASRPRSDRAIASTTP